MNLNDALNKKVQDFVENLACKTESEKNYFHYNSVLNLSKRIILYKDEKAHKLKEKLLNYFIVINDMNYKINNKLLSSQMHNEYILPVEQYLIKKEHFVTNSDLHLFIIIGVIIDVGLCFPSF